MTASIEFIPHTADIRLKISEETLPELFLKSLKGMNELLKPGLCKETVDTEKTEQIDLQALDTTILLVDFLSEVLTLSNVNKTVYCQFNITSMCDHELKGYLTGK